MAYAILRTKKIKDATAITQAEMHNLRKRYANNVDKSKSHLNKILVDEFNVMSGGKNLNARLQEYYKEKKVKQRKNSVQMMEFVLTASPEFFKNKNEKQIQEWADHQIEFMKKKFGEQLKFAVLHLDETSPHIHVMLSTEQKSIKKYKNQFGEFHKESYSLSVEKYDRGFLIDLQTEYAEHNKVFNLQRGMRNSKIYHTTLKEFYRQANKVMSADYKTTVMNVLGKLKSNIFGYVKDHEVKHVFERVLEKVDKQVKAVSFFQKNFNKRIVDYNRNVERLNNRAVELTDLQEELTEKENMLKIRKKRYNEALQTHSFNLNTIREQRDKITALEEEQKRLIEKYEPVKIDSSTNQSKLGI